MTLPDGKETRDQAADQAPSVERAIAMHREQADMADGTAGGETTSAAPGRHVPAGTSLAETEAPIAFDPFPAGAARDPEPPPSKSYKTLLLDYSAHAAMIVGLIGFAWTVSDHVVTHRTAAGIEATAAASQQEAAQPAAPERDRKRDELSELRSANERMAKDVDALRAELGTLHAALQRDQVPGQVRALAGDLEGVKAGLSTVKGETTTAIAVLSDKIDKAQRETNAKVQHLATASGPLERQGVDTTSTGSITPNEMKPAEVRPVATKPGLPVQSHALPIPAPVAKPAPATRLASAEDVRKDEARKDEAHKTLADKAGGDATAKSAVLPGWVVREVYQGVALIEGRRGELEVVPGVSIPGAGVVKSIDRHGNGWTVTTTKGLLASAAPPRDYRRATRDYYPDARDDF